MTKINFNPKNGLKTLEGAQARIDNVAHLLTTSFTLISVQDGKYFPVAILSAEDACNAFHVASSGVYATRA